LYRQLPGADATGSIVLLEGDEVFIGVRPSPGYELIVELRCNSTFDSMPILMVSTEGSDAQREKAIAAGANGYLAKPVMEAAFCEKLRTLGFDVR
jgi:DNA-binding response OmpR family regulator